MAQIERTKQTTEKFYQALIQMQNDGEDYSAITVQQISTYAALSRQTFYRHYQNKDDIISFKIHDFKMATLQQLTHSDQLTADLMIKTLLTFWNDHRTFFNLIMWAGLQDTLVGNIVFLNNKIMKFNNVSHLNADYIINTYAGATYQFLKTYLTEKPGSSSIETVIKLFLDMTNGYQLLFE